MGTQIPLEVPLKCDGNAAGIQELFFVKGLGPFSTFSPLFLERSRIVIIISAVKYSCDRLRNNQFPAP
jgi:hypothetical protein